MRKHTRVFIIFALLILVIMISKFYIEYQDKAQLKIKIVKEEAKALSAFMVAFRQTYQKSFIENHIPINEKTINLLPVRTTKEIGDTFSRIINNAVIIKTVSDRPRNPINKANTQEMKIINYFNSNKKEKYYFEDLNGEIFYYAKPLYIKQGCLKCHGKKKNAIKTVRDNYDTAYGYKLGDLRGILSLKLSKNDIIKRIDTSYERGIQTAVAVYLLFVLSIYFMIRIIVKNEDEYTGILEEKVQVEIEKNEQIQQLYRELEESEHELQLLNENLEIKIQEEVEKNKKIQTHLFKSEKMASMGEMIGNIAHQWRQPLSTISTGATGLQVKKEYGKLDDEFFNDTCEMINRNAQYLSETIDDFKNFIKGDRELLVFNLSETIGSFVHLIEPSIKRHNINLVLDLQDDIECENYPNELIQCLVNIFNNAKDILKLEIDNEDDRLFMIKTSQKDDNVVIEIQDSGGGIPEDILHKIFEPYFTTKHKSQGTGLGLHMTYNLVVNGMNGTIEVYNKIYEYNDKSYTGAKFIIKY